MKFTLAAVAVAATVGSVEATFGGWTNAPRFNTPDNCDNKCIETQKNGWTFDDLEIGTVGSYKDFNFNGWTCGEDKSKRDLKTRTFGRSISGECGSEPSTAPSFGCDGKNVEKFSVKKFHVKVEFDCRLEFHYEMPDGSNCKHSADCTKGGTDVSNTQCGGAKKVKIVYPKQDKPKNKCRVEIPKIDFDCEKPTTPCDTGKCHGCKKGMDCCKKGMPCYDECNPGEACCKKGMACWDECKKDDKCCKKGTACYDDCQKGEKCCKPGMPCYPTDECKKGDSCCKKGMKCWDECKNDDKCCKKGTECYNDCKKGEKCCKPGMPCNGGDDKTSTAPAPPKGTTTDGGEKPGKTTTEEGEKPGKTTTAPGTKETTTEEGEKPGKTTTAPGPEGDKTTTAPGSKDTSSAPYPPPGGDKTTTEEGEKPGKTTTAPGPEGDKTTTAPGSKDTTTEGGEKPGKTTTAPGPGGDKTTTAPGSKDTTTEGGEKPGKTTTAPGPEGDKTTTAPGSKDTTTEGGEKPGKTTTAPGPEGDNTTTAPGPAGDKTTTAPGSKETTEGGEKPEETKPPVVTTYDTTSTIYTTDVRTITDCGDKVPNCPAGSTKVTTVTVPVTTTVCPVTETIPQGPKETKPAQTTPQGPKETTPATGGNKDDEPLPCPEVVPSCLNTFLDYLEDCKDNSDAKCFCPKKDFVDKVYSCLYAYGGSDDIVAEAVSFFQGICAPYVGQNPGIVTGAEPITKIITVTGTTVIPTAAYTTVVVATTVTEPCVTGGTTIPGSSTVRTISTEVVVPDVGFTTAPSGGVALIPPATTAQGAKPGQTGVTTKAPPAAGTGNLPAPTPTKPADGIPVAAGAGRAGMGIAAAIFAAALAL